MIEHCAKMTKLLRIELLLQSNYDYDYDYDYYYESLSLHYYENYD